MKPEVAFRPVRIPATSRQVMRVTVEEDVRFFQSVRQHQPLVAQKDRRCTVRHRDAAISRVGLGSFGMKAPVLEHFRRISDPDSQYRLASQREAVMEQVEKTATAARAEESR